MARSASDARSASVAGDGLALKRSLAVDPESLAGARRALVAWLADARVAQADVNDVLLASNEACMNAVEHSGAPADGSIDLRATIEGPNLTVVVQDAGRWREPQARRDRGHGLGLMREVMDTVRIDRDAEGTKVTLEKQVVFGDASPAATETPSVELQTVDGTTVATLRGEIDLANVDAVSRELDAATGPSHAAVVVDLSSVTYLDSSGIHMLFRLARRRRTARQLTRLAAPPGAVRNVLELTGVEQAIPLDDTVSAAVAGIAEDPG